VSGRQHGARGCPGQGDILARSSNAGRRPSTERDLGGATGVSGHAAHLLFMETKCSSDEETWVAVDYAARDPKDIAALFPVPRPEIADRLAVLLLPHLRIEPKGREAA
jgi:hypothetical protein